MDDGTKRANFINTKYSWDLQTPFEITLGTAETSHEIMDYISKRCKRKPRADTTIDVKFYIPSHGDAASIKQPRGQADRVFVMKGEPDQEYLPAKIEMDGDKAAVLYLTVSKEGVASLKEWLRHHLNVGENAIIHFYIYVNAECYLTIVVEMARAQLVKPEKTEVMDCTFEENIVMEDKQKIFTIQIPEACAQWTVNKINESFPNLPPEEEPTIPPDGYLGILLEPKRNFHLRQLHALPATWKANFRNKEFPWSFQLGQRSFEKLKQKLKSSNDSSQIHFKYWLLYQGSYLPSNANSNNQDDGPETISQADVKKEHAKPSKKTETSAKHSWQPLFSFLSEQLMADPGVDEDETRGIELYTVGASVDALLKRIPQDDLPINPSKIMQQYPSKNNSNQIELSNAINIVQMDEKDATKMGIQIKFTGANKDWFQKEFPDAANSISVRFTFRQTPRSAVKQIFPRETEDKYVDVHVQETPNAVTLVKHFFSDTNEFRNIVAIIKQPTVKFVAVKEKSGKLQISMYGSIDDEAKPVAKERAPSTHAEKDDTMSSRINDELIESYMNYLDMLSRLFDYPQLHTELWKEMTDLVKEIESKEIQWSDIETDIQDYINKHYDPNAGDQTPEKPDILKPYAQRLQNAMNAKNSWAKWERQPP